MLLALTAGAIAIVSPGSDDGTRVVVGASATSSTTEMPSELDTTTTTTIVPTTLPTVDVPTTVPTARPRPTTSTTAPTTSLPDSRRTGVSPLEPGTQEWGYGGLGASRDVTQGRTRVVWAVYMRDLYKD